MTLLRERLSAERFGYMLLILQQKHFRLIHPASLFIVVNVFSKDWRSTGRYGSFPVYA